MSLCSTLGPVAIAHQIAVSLLPPNVPVLIAKQIVASLLILSVPAATVKQIVVSLVMANVQVAIAAQNAVRPRPLIVRVSAKRPTSVADHAPHQPQQLQNPQHQHLLVLSRDVPVPVAPVTTRTTAI